MTEKKISINAPHIYAQKCLTGLHSQSVWSIRLHNVTHQIDAFLRRSYRYGFIKEIAQILTVIDPAVYRQLFNKVKTLNHCSFPSPTCL